MTETIERILHVLPVDNVLICECGAAMRYNEVIHYLAKCPKCHKEQDYRTMQTISLAAYVAISLAAYVENEITKLNK